MMDFILRSQADAVIRGELLDERIQKAQREIDELVAESREFRREQRKYEKRVRTLEASDRRTRIRVRGIKDLMMLFSKRFDCT